MRAHDLCGFYSFSARVTTAALRAGQHGLPSEGLPTTTHSAGRWSRRVEALQATLGKGCGEHEASDDRHVFGHSCGLCARCHQKSTCIEQRVGEDKTPGGPPTMLGSKRRVKVRNLRCFASTAHRVPMSSVPSERVLPSLDCLPDLQRPSGHDHRHWQGGADDTDTQDGLRGGSAVRLQPVRPR